MLSNRNVHDSAVILLREGIIHPRESVCVRIGRNRRRPHDVSYPERFRNGFVCKILLIETVSYKKRIAGRVSRFIRRKPAGFILEVINRVIVVVNPLDNPRRDFRALGNVARRVRITANGNYSRNFVAFRLHFENGIHKRESRVLIDIYRVVAVHVGVGEIEIKEIDSRKR